MQRILETRKEISEIDLERHLSGKFPTGNDTCTNFFKMSWLLSDQERGSFGMGECVRFQLQYSEAQKQSGMEH